MTTIVGPDHKPTNQQIHLQPRINSPMATHKSTKSIKNQTQINPNHKPDLDLVLLRRDFNWQPQARTVYGTNR
jgi:hypothetical protein